MATLTPNLDPLPALNFDYYIVCLNWSWIDERNALLK